MTIKTETEAPVLTYSKTRGIVANLTGTSNTIINYPSEVVRKQVMYFVHCPPFDNCFLLFLSFSAFMKQRRMGLNDFIQRLASNSYACKQ